MSFADGQCRSGANIDFNMLLNFNFIICFVASANFCRLFLANAYPKLKSSFWFLKSKPLPIRLIANAASAATIVNPSVTRTNPRFEYAGGLSGMSSSSRSCSTNVISL